MRVMCIGSTWNYNRGPVPPYIKYPKYGEICLVVREDNDNDGLFYVLMGYKGYKYWQGFFIPLSETDESEEQRERLKEVNLSRSFEKLKTLCP